MTSPPSAERVRPRSVLTTGLWFGALAGLVELAWVAYRKFVMHRMIGMGPDAAWMTPAADILLVGIPAAILALWAFRRPDLRLWRFGLGMSAFMALATVLSLIEGLHPASVALLAAGVAVQLARVARTREAGFERFFARTAPWLLATAVVVGAGAVGWRFWRERRALASLPAAGAGAPNVLLLVLDTVRAASLSLYGYSAPTTPNLDRLSTQSVVFDRAVASAPWTLPSHASLFTGPLAS